MSEFSVPSQEDFFQESCRFLTTCRAECSCSNAWHFMWSGFKASGRRRSIYYQQPLLKKMLAPMRQSIRSVLIAGAADAGILTVLDSIFRENVRYVALDICNAPAVEMKWYANLRGLSIEFQKIPLEQFVPQEKFDLIFISNTFIFMQTDVVFQALRQLQQGLRTDSWMVCGMRYEQKVQENSPATPEASAKDFRSMISKTYTSRPDLVALIEPHIDPYFESMRLTQRHPYEPVEFASILDATGYRSVDHFRDDITPTNILNTVSRGSITLSDVHLLQLK